MPALLNILEQPGFASEMMKDGRCPTCRTERTSSLPAGISEYKCQICGRTSLLYVDQYKTLTSQENCRHARVVTDGAGKNIIEFKE